MAIKKSLGRGEAQTIGVNMPEKMANDLEKRAASMHISTSNYCKIVLRHWIDSGKKLVLTEKQ